MGMSRGAVLTSAKRLTGAAGPDAAAAIASAPAPKVAAAPRQLQGRWLIGVVAVVLLGGVLLLYAVPSYTGHTAVVVMARDVKVGAILTAEDLGTADVSVGDAVAVVHPGDGVLGKTALTDLPAGRC